jgi:hypothetical protein
VVTNSRPVAAFAAIPLTPSAGLPSSVVQVGMRLTNAYAWSMSKTRMADATMVCRVADTGHGGVEEAARLLRVSARRPAGGGSQAEGQDAHRTGPHETAL